MLQGQVYNKFKSFLFSLTFLLNIIGCSYDIYERREIVKNEYTKESNDLLLNLSKNSSQELLNMFFRSNIIAERISILTILNKRNDNFEYKLLLMALNDYPLIVDNAVIILLKYDLLPFQADLVYSINNINIENIINRNLSTIIVTNATSNLKISIRYTKYKRYSQDTSYNIHTYDVQFFNLSERLSYIDNQTKEHAKEIKYTLLKMYKNYILNHDLYFKKIFLKSE